MVTGAYFDALDRGRVGDLAGQEGSHPAGIVGMDEVEERHADEDIAWISENSFDRRTLIANATVQPDDGDDVGGILDDGAEVLFAAADGLERFLPLRHVPGHATSDGRRRRIRVQPIAVLPEAPAALAPHYLHDAVGETVALQPLQIRGEPGRRFRW